MIDLITLGIAFFDTNKELQFTLNFGDVTGDRPIEMHDIRVGSIRCNVGSFVASDVSITAHVVDVNAEPGHIEAIPVARAVERHGLDIVVVLNRNSLELFRHRDDTILTDYNMRFGLGVS